MKVNIKLVVWRVLLVCLALFMARLALVIFMSDHYMEQYRDGDDSALDTALWWDSSNPRALLAKGGQLFEAERYDEAEPLLVQAVKANPADARALVFLAEMRRREGELALADQMMETADRLEPVDSDVQIALAQYWARREIIPNIVPHMSKALSGDAAIRQDNYPFLLLLADSSEYRHLLQPITDEPPNWWPAFFSYALREAVSIDTPRQLMNMRQASPTHALTDAERAAYIARLRTAGLVGEAYLQWVNSLDADTIGSLGYLFNGTFEKEFSNVGFGWFVNPPRNSGIRITTSNTYGVGDKEALSLRFSGKRVRFNHMYQHLYLGPGNYVLTGRARPDKLKARRGLQWYVYCGVGASGTLGESELFVGTGDWRSFEFNIDVPDDCTGQILRLRSAGSRDVDHELDGGMWFDDMRIALER